MGTISFIWLSYNTIVNYFSATSLSPARARPRHSAESLALSLLDASTARGDLPVPMVSDIQWLVREWTDDGGKVFFVLFKMTAFTHFLSHVVLSPALHWAGRGWLVRRRGRVRVGRQRCGIAAPPDVPAAAAADGEERN